MMQQIQQQSREQESRYQTMMSTQNAQIEELKRRVELGI